VSWIIVVGVIAVGVYGFRTWQHRRNEPVDLEEEIALVAIGPEQVDFEAPASISYGAGPLSRRWRQGFLDVHVDGLAWRSRLGLPPRSHHLGGLQINARREPRGIERIMVHHHCQVLECEVGGTSLRLAIPRSYIPGVLRGIRPRTED
jgi:hypothetical protein